MRADAWFERGSGPRRGDGLGAYRLLDPVGFYPGPAAGVAGPQETC